MGATDIPVIPIEFLFKSKYMEFRMVIKKNENELNYVIFNRYHMCVLYQIEYFEIDIHTDLLVTIMSVMNT